MYLLDSSKQKEAIELATKLDENITGISLQVRWQICVFFRDRSTSYNETFLPLQLCTEIYNALRNSEFGATEKEAEEYKVKCHKLYPYATVFKNEQWFSLDDGGDDACTVKKPLAFSKTNVLESRENRQENCEENFQENCQEISVRN